MENDYIKIETNDCLNFDPKWNDALQYFAEQNQVVSVFNISKKLNTEEPVITYNFQDRKWYANRYIGNINFSYNKMNYSINIKPRFGDVVLLKMFEELFNVKFASGHSSFKTEDNAYYLKLLISFIWLQKLANANRHGLPRVKRMTLNESYAIKGRFLIRPSIVPIHETGKVISVRKEQVFDQVVIRILYQAYCILKNDYQLGQLKIPANALDAIQNIDNHSLGNRFIHLYEYQSIKYHPIYQNYKDIIDFSWQIIESQPGYNRQSNKNNVSGFFLDMAEIWECYIRAIMKKHFTVSSWQMSESQYEVYPQRFYGRKIIPDIVMKKGNDFCVFDAKYKNMQYRPGFIDVDRNDFFQIHTYISFLQTKGNVILGGLLYPVTKIDNDIEISPIRLFSNDDVKTHFVVDGPVVMTQSIDTVELLSNISKYMI
jgi:5-methylcytosine-specific restriction enzyme subunit McrC